MRPILFFVFFLALVTLKAEDGYELWLRYKALPNSEIRDRYVSQLGNIVVFGHSSTTLAIKDELKRGMSGLLNQQIVIDSVWNNQKVVIGTSVNSPLIASLHIDDQLKGLGTEGYLITTKNIDGKPVLLIAAQTDIGLLYGMFHLLRLIQTEQDLKPINIVESPKTTHRLLNHWDNLDRTVERGYAGFSIWDWHKLPDYIDPRYKDYARANASIGINGSVVNNVNANALILTPQYLLKLKALADVFRPFGIKVYLTARFSAPKEIGGLETADPLDADVIKWWDNKAKEIYSIIPDFGGFMVKTNSEGQPGPQDYNRTHADGANMLANAVGPFNNIII